jgi:hypothetical protein
MRILQSDGARSGQGDHVSNRSSHRQRRIHQTKLNVHTPRTMLRKQALDRQAHSPGDATLRSVDQLGDDKLTLVAQKSIEEFRPLVPGSRRPAGRVPALTRGELPTGHTLDRVFRLFFHAPDGTMQRQQKEAILKSKPHNTGQIRHRTATGQFKKPAEKQRNGAESAAADRKLQEEAYLRRGANQLQPPAEMQQMDAEGLWPGITTEPIGSTELGDSEDPSGRD